MCVVAGLGRGGGVGGVMMATGNTRTIKRLYESC